MGRVGERMMSVGYCSDIDANYYYGSNLKCLEGEKWEGGVLGAGLWVCQSCFGRAIT